MTSFPERLKELRKDKKLSQNALSKRIGISQAAIAKWEKGTRTPSMECIIILTKYFNVTAGYLLGLED